jgi:uncharacterized protein (TIGR03663 family)
VSLTPPASDKSIDTLSRHGQRLLHSTLRGFSVWHLLYAAIFLAALLTRFWDLGSRALHHDESLHTYYSWVFSEGRGYEHHPMMHGPFLFHINALSYLVFGASDYTSRLTVALFGIVLVMLPWFLRGPAFLGRWGALIASTLLLISPSILYYSRFIRHDIFALVGALLIVIAFVRYMERPESRWIILALVSLGFVLTTHEVTFVNLFILGTFAGALILYRVVPISLAFIAGAVVFFLVGREVFSRIGITPVPEIPWENPSTLELLSYLGGLLTHPIVALGVSMALFTIISIIWLIDTLRDPEAGFIDGIFGHTPPDSTADRFADALHDGRAWLIGAVGGFSLFAVLYTSIFSNLSGLGSGTLGALGYWLGQHGVQRGQQPWFYYLVLTPQYEYLAILGSLSAVAFLGIYVLRNWRSNRGFDQRFYFLALTLYWAVVMFVVLSWAGEKMPWLIVHFLLPMILLAGAMGGVLIEWIEEQTVEWRRSLNREFLYTGLPIGILLVTSLVLMAWISAGPYVETDGALARTLRASDPAAWWLVYLPFLLAVLVIILAWARDAGARVLSASAVALCALLVVLQINAGWNLTYRDGDVPRDMLVYVQTSPHLRQTVDELRMLSFELNGDMSMPITFTGTSQWPLNWYLRDFTARSLVHEIPEEPTAPIIIATPGDIGGEEEQRLSDYTWVQHPLRWWIPEDETYRRFAIAPELNTEWRQNLQTDDPPPYSLADVARSVGRSVASISEPEQQARFFRMVVYRELDAPIGTYSYRIYVHDDYLQRFNAIRYGDHVAVQ